MKIKIFISLLFVIQNLAYAKLLNDDEILAVEKIMLAVDSRDFKIDKNGHIEIVNEQLNMISQFKISKTDTFDINFINISSLEIDFVLKFLNKGRIEKIRFDNCIINNDKLNIDTNYLESLGFYNSTLYNFNIIVPSSKLKELTLRNCNEIEHDFKIIFKKYPNLKVLRLSNLDLSFTNDLFDLEYLESLSLNNIVFLDYLLKEEYNLKSEDLKELYLHSQDDFISKLNLTNLVKLEKLWLFNSDTYNYDEVLNKIFDLNALKEIYFKNENIIYLPNSMCSCTSLQKITIENSYLEELPICIDKLNNLKLIEISNSNLKLNKNNLFPKNLETLRLYKSKSNISDLDSLKIKHIKNVSIHSNR